jgi:hypothetical protein
MRYVKWSVIAVLTLLVAGFLHYTLPRHDIVRIVGVENQRSKTGDVRYINAMTTNNEPIIYRNEATGWGWPPYFKIGAAGVQAKAQDLVSTREAPKWVVVRRYGWRNSFLAMFPNAMSLRQVDSPDVLLIPWLNIVILTLLAAALLWVRALWRRFWRWLFSRTNAAGDRVDRKQTPVVAAQSADAAGDLARGLWQQIKDVFPPRR